MVRDIVALIPARSGSKRIPDKNIKDFFGHPLLAYTIKAAIDSGLFLGEGNIYHKIYVSSDSNEYRNIALKYGATPHKRPTEFALDTSTDYDWVCDVLRHLEHYQGDFVILRPTNPFRTAETIKRAYKVFKSCGYPSLRGVEKVKQHPHKTWRWLENKKAMLPMCFGDGSNNFHNMPTQLLAECYAQNASMDMGNVGVLASGQITGRFVYPFFTEGYEGFDINTPEDWILAEELVKRGLAKLPEVK